MTSFDSFSLSKNRAEEELVQLRQLLDIHSHTPLRERGHITAFFQNHRHAASLTGSYNSNLVSPDRLAFEFDVFDDRQADLVVGDSQNHQYCFAKFEDATETSIFTKSARDTLDWSPRFHHGFSQIIDWIWWLDNQRGTAAYTSRFGVASIQFVAVLVIGRDRFLEKPLHRERLTWRSEQVIVASRKVNCVTYDQLSRELSRRLKVFGD
jgi:hypothetical protein